MRFTTTRLRLWHGCRHLETKDFTNRMIRTMSVIVLIWFILWFAPYMLTRIFTSLPQMPSAAVTAGIAVLVSLFITCVIISILGGVYGGYRTRTLATLDTTYYLLKVQWDAYGNAVGIKDGKINIKEWIIIPLPLARKHYLIQAGIPASQALTAETQALTRRDLEVLIVLQGRVPTPPQRSLSGEVEYV